MTKAEMQKDIDRLNTNLRAMGDRNNDLHSEIKALKLEEKRTNQLRTQIEVIRLAVETALCTKYPARERGYDYTESSDEERYLKFLIGLCADRDLQKSDQYALAA